jgi:hypothetical protein
VRARLHHDRRRGETRGERGEALAGVDDYFLGDDVTGGIEDARAVAAVPEVQSDGQFFTSRYFCVHTAGDYTPAFSFLLVGLFHCWESTSSFFSSLARRR